MNAPAFRIQQRQQPQPPARREALVCPNPDCGKTYQIDPSSLGLVGRRVRCPACQTLWYDMAIIREDKDAAVNPILTGDFPRKLKLYLNGLPDKVKTQSKSSTHAIKTFLIRHGVATGAIGHANAIKVDLPYHRTTEFMWDVVAKVESDTYPGDDVDLLFVAESENQSEISKIIEDAKKLPIARADARLMFFRAPDTQALSVYFDRLHDLFRRHRKTEAGDIYILAGMNQQTLAYRVRKLVIRRQGSNVSPWEEY